MHQPLAWVALASAAVAGALWMTGTAGVAATLGGCDTGDGSAGESCAADAGTDAGTTVGDQCATIVTAFCEQATGPCATGATLADCIANDMPMCCAGSTCDAQSASPACAISACTMAISQEDCNSVVASGLPSACQGLPVAQ
jgi:hypothetical protein